MLRSQLIDKYCGNQCWRNKSNKKSPKIIVAKKSCPTNDCKNYEMGGCWVVNHDIIRITEIEWEPKYLEIDDAFFINELSLNRADF